jgi:hypothetical protein
MADTQTSHDQDYEVDVGLWLDRPYIQLAIGIIVVLMLVFLALKAGFSLWLMSKLGLGERLVNEAGDGPDFWTITSTLDAYQRPAGNPQATIKSEPDVAAPAPAKKERFSGRRERLTPRLLAAL